MKYRELIEELKKLTEEQLDQEVFISGEDIPISRFGGLWIAEEDMINPTGEGAEYISAYTDPEITDDPMTEEEVRAENEVCIKKGSIFLITAIPSCRVCGCTEYCACPEGCYWVEDDLCSACASKLKAGKTAEEIRIDNLRAQGAPL